MTISIGGLRRLVGGALWRNPRRRVQRLLSFARTEAGGAADIAAAAADADSPELRQHLQRHAADERRHAALLRGRAQQLFDVGNTAPTSAGADLLPSSGIPADAELSLTDHGFLPSARRRELGELRYVAMLYLAECQAKADFELHVLHTAGRDEATAAVFRSILRDEEYHIAYTRALLRGWEQQGRAREVRAALREMRRARRHAALLRCLGPINRTSGRIVLAVVYATLFLPFGLLGRLGRHGRGWLAVRRAGDDALAAL
ncbi:MAG TPA: hypothetical protein VK348_10000, partial [Planctomycetota bacterium]|nr:hypothetical protein [Planctomycetota bacterium]